MMDPAKKLRRVMRATSGRLEQRLDLPGGEVRLVVASKAEVAGGLGLEVPYVLISMLDPEDAGVALPEDGMRFAALWLRFHDTKQLADDPGLPDDVRPITRDQARQIGIFATQHLPVVKVFVVHCHHGMSRSPAVAAAIAHGIGGSSAFWFENKLPNRTVFDLVVSEWPA